jgi:integration host factor subunit alpha
MAITKKELTDIIYDNMGLFRVKSTKIVNRVFDIIENELTGGNTVIISGFGKWAVKKKGSMIGRDLQTGEPITISSHKVVTFKCSQRVKKLLNG